jgi:hypothetical protein
MSFLRTVSPVAKVYWAGWESNTYALQRAGWQLAKKDCYPGHRYQFAFSHPQYRFWGLSEPVDMRDAIMAVTIDGRRSGYNMPPIVIRHMASDLRIETRDATYDSMFMPIDATPGIEQVHTISMADMDIFRIIGDAKEILVPEPNVSELLSQIIEKQAPYQKELREKRRRNYRKFQQQVDELTRGMKNPEPPEPKKELVAQIISV